MTNWQCIHPDDFIIELNTLKGEKQKESHKLYTYIEGILTITFYLYNGQQVFMTTEQQDNNLGNTKTTYYKFISEGNTQ